MGGNYDLGKGYNDDGYAKISQLNFRKNVIYRDVYGELSVPVRDTYEFLEWYTAKDGGMKVMSSILVSYLSEHTLYARWGIYLYNLGYENKDITGGRTYANNANGSIIKNTTNIYSLLYGVISERTYGMIHTVNKIDLTNYKKIVVNDD